MVSIVIPAKNEEKYIGDCLQSIYMQQGVEFEVIVVDNNSTDETVQVVAQNFPAARIVAESKPGTNNARHRGYLESKGDIVIFLDADVRLPRPDWLQAVITRMQDTTVVALSSHYRYYDFAWYDKFIQTVSQFAFVYAWLFIVNTVLHVTATMVGGMMVLRRSALEQIGGLSVDTVFFGDEVLLSKKLYPLGKMVISPKYWVYNSARRYKQHGLIRTSLKYVFNYFWVLIMKHPYHSSDTKSVR